MKHIIDRFGENVYTMQTDYKHFIAKVPVSLSPAFYVWMFFFSGKMNIISPKVAVDGFENMLNKFK